jgi:hypothetical protein
MPILTTPDWDRENVNLIKRPFYLVVIGDLVEALSTFRAEDMQVVWGGYGIGGYGINPYGY